MSKFAGKLHLPVMLSVAAFVSACAVGPDYRAPDTQSPEQFTQLDAATFSAQPAADQFWKQFGDPVLDQLVADALFANHDLRIAAARFAEARALRRNSQLDLLPTVTAAGGYTRQQLADAATFGGPKQQEFYDAGFDASWELDLFGRVRRQLEASTAQLQASQAELRDVRVSVMAEVSRTYFEMRGQQAQLQVAQRNVENQSQSFRLTSVRLDAGRGTELDTSRARAQLSATKAMIAPLQAAIARSIYRLGVLTGRAPDALTTLLSGTQPLPVIEATIAVGDPADLLRRRPDIRISERDLAAQTAGIGIAVADLFPRVSFVGSVGYTAAQAGDLGRSGTGGYLLAPGISWAAFDLGRVRAAIAAARSRNDAALARYEQTVLRALEETEGALVTHARSRDRLSQLADSADASQTAARLARLRFENGAVDFLQVLDSERTLLEAEDRLAIGKTETATSLVAVYKALGGGWESGPLSR